MVTEFLFENFQQRSEVQIEQTLTAADKKQRLERADGLLHRLGMGVAKYLLVRANELARMEAYL